MVQGAQSETPPETSVSDAMHTLAQQDRENTKPELEMEVMEADNAVEGSSAHTAPGDDTLPVTYPDEHIPSGRWSPSRIMD
jgi:hypothetical protein